MAKYSSGAGRKVEKVMHEYKQGKLKSSSGDKVTSRKQAIAIGLSEAREEGEKVPRKTSRQAGRKSAGTKSATKRKTAGKKSATRKTATRKTAAKKSATKRTASKRSSPKKATTKRASTSRRK